MKEKIEIKENNADMYFVCQCSAKSEQNLKVWVYVALHGSISVYE